jgi:hypothetical protein
MALIFNLASGYGSSSNFNQMSPAVQVIDDNVEIR